MPADFLPLSTAGLTESTSLALRDRIERQKISTDLGADPIETSFVHQGKGGSPILLLHGFDSSVFEFRRILPLLSTIHETWAVDMLGFGFTDRPAGLAYSPAVIRSHLFGFWQTRIRRRVILVGASMGGATAIDFALAHPECVEKLVLVSSVGFTSGVPPLARYLFPPFDALAVEFLRSDAVRVSVARRAYWDPKLATADARLCAALHLRMPDWSRAMVSFTKSGGYVFTGEQIRRVDKPTLILWGKNDQILGTLDAEQFQRHITGSTLSWIEQCGHVPHLERPHVTAERILHFSSL